MENLGKGKNSIVLGNCDENDVTPKKFHNWGEFYRILFQREIFR